ncbi:MAG: alpha-2-macroglobulin, partial [Prevotella sp.]|nr:alpha-2-macroglobulin [Prevotella sp.]
RKSLANPSLLAHQKAAGYQPLIVKGKDDAIFNGDLLHVIGMQADDHAGLSRYYAAQGNREAACYTAMMDASGKADALQRLDSLITVYGDLPICGEVAVSRYGLFANDVSAEDRMSFIDKSLNRWGNWQGMNTLRNARMELTNPYFESDIASRWVTPDNNNNRVALTVRNMGGVTLTITRTSLGGNTKLNPDNARDLVKIKAGLVASTRQTLHRTFSGYKDYEVLKDTFNLPVLPVGVYLLEFTSSSPKVIQRNVLYFVSSLYVLSEGQPGRRIRYVVVDAITGQPVAGAKVQLTTDGSYGRKPTVQTLTTNKEGEASYAYAGSQPDDVYVYTDNDRSFPSTSLWSSYGFNQYEAGKKVSNVYTDRRIYRPGQTVHASVIVYHEMREGLKTKAEAGKTFELILRDTNYKKVGIKAVTTDRFGTAAADFELPSNGLTGRFSIYADYGTKGSASFNVEEYKRPTFEVSFDDYKEKYSAGDTVVLKGHAKSYAGVPVQGAKVHYTVTRRQNRWWWNSYDGDEEVMEKNVMTDEKGDFSVTLPFNLPEDVMDDLRSSHKLPARFYQFVVEADVTDAAGESRQGSVSLPLGTKTAALVCDVPDKNLRDSLKTIRFDYLNAAGHPVDGIVKYVIVAQQKDKSKYTYHNYLTVKANEPVPVKHLSPGAYRLHAICGTDTVDTDFIVFSMNDRHPVIETHDWFYVSAGEFPRDGSPVYLQVGSSDKDQHVVYSIYSGNRVLESGSFDQSNSNLTRKFVYKEEYGDGITLNYAWVKNGQAYKHTESVSRPLPDKRLLVKWKTFRDKLSPGQHEEWTLTVQRPDGRAADAQLMATLYDKSLDQILQHSWMLSPSFSLNMPSTSWDSPYRQSTGVSSFARYSSLPENVLSFSTFDDRFLMGFEDADIVFHGVGGRRKFVMLSRSVGGVNKTDSESDMFENKVFAVAEQVPALSKSERRYTAPVIKKDSDVRQERDGQQGGTVSMRENLNETAFFYPRLQTDGNGTVSINFTLPESLTTWHFMGIAHDEDMNNGFLSDDVVAQKTLMVQPNMPRFVRMGDDAMVSARLLNQSDKAVNAKAKLEIIDPATENVLYADSKDVVLPEKGSVSAVYSLGGLLSETAGRIMPNQSLLIARFSVEGDGHADGEQHYLPVLQNSEYVTNTYPFTQNQPGTKTIDLGTLFPKHSSAQKLTVEYTNNPNWLMIQALPYVADVDDKNAISLVSAYYANSLARMILSESPKIRQAITLWKLEKGTETSMMSALEKNQKLKSLTLEETPWLMDANRENEQKRMLVRFFDENQLQNRLSTALTRLKKLQNPDGSFSWWQGMDGSLYMTVAVVKTLVRLDVLAGKTAETTSLVKSAFRFLDKEVARRVAAMKRQEKMYRVTLFPYDDLCDYLYANALAGRAATADISYLIDRLSHRPSDLSIYGKANTAVILSQYGKMTKAQEYLQSIREYTVCTEEKGRYFDTKRAYYSWRDYKIPTEVAAIEAIKSIMPDEVQLIEEMQRWLLQEKRTQAWDTPLNSVNAVWAFMNKGSWLMDNGENAHLALDGEPLQTTQATAGIGYVKAVQPVNFQASVHHEFTVEKSGKGTSWGAVYAQFFQPASEVAEATAGLKVTREVLADSVQTKNGRRLRVGDKVRIRLTVTADRDYDFVQVVDKRAACLEPVSQLSGYHGGYYIVPKDYTTNYYFDRMAKGMHVVETEYFIDRAGTYQTGICTAQCAYAPEYSGRTGAMRLVVDN